VRNAAEERPRRIEPINERFSCLQERGPHELVAARRQRDDEHVQLALLTALAAHVAHQAEIQVRFFASRRVIDAHRGAAPAETKLGLSRTTQRRVRDIAVVLLCHPAKRLEMAP